MSADSTLKGKNAEVYVRRRYRMAAPPAAAPYDGVEQNGDTAEIKAVNMRGGRLFFGEYERSVAHMRDTAARANAYFVDDEGRVLKIPASEFLRLIDTYGRVQYQVSVPKAEAERLAAEYGGWS